MKPLGRYDTSLQMFVDEPHELDVARLEYYRWLARTGRYDDDSDPNERREWRMFERAMCANLK